MRFGDDDAGVTIATADGIADVRLDRPAKLNALKPAVIRGIEQALAHLSDMADLRCVVLSGGGRSFSAGMDLEVLATGALSIGPLGPRSHGKANLAQHCALGWRELPVPVIAAIHGHCFGGGLQIAMGADVRIAAPDARLSIMEAKHGLVPDMGLYVLARRVVREDVLRELIFTARQVSGEEAQTLGLVTRVATDPLAEAMALAQDIAAKSPAAIRAAKRLANAMDEGDGGALLQAESDEQTALIDGLLKAMRSD